MLIKGIILAIPPLVGIEVVLVPLWEPPGGVFFLVFVEIREGRKKVSIKTRKFFVKHFSTHGISFDFFPLPPV
jgi:hypothetical protein